MHLPHPFVWIRLPFSSLAPSEKQVRQPFHQRSLLDRYFEYLSFLQLLQHVQYTEINLRSRAEIAKFVLHVFDGFLPFLVGLHGWVSPYF